MTTKSPELVQSVRLPLSKIQPNNGQIEGLPKNPRFIRDEKFKKLVRSIEDNPEMTALREVLVYPHGGKYVIIGGNMRYQALKELGYKEAICKVLPENTTPEQLQAYTIKDNAGFGEWDFDLLANDWDADLLDLWGVDVPEVDTEVSEEEEGDSNYSRKIEIPIYTPSETEATFSEMYDTKTYDNLCRDIEAADLPKEVADFLKFGAMRHVKYNYEKIADFYARADKKVQLLMEDSALVIIDFDKAIERGFVEVTERLRQQYYHERKE
jgi:hypothetical protein